MHEIIPIGKFPKKKDFGRPVSDTAGYQGIEADFKERYMDVLQSAPELPAARIKYFCSVLLHLCAEEGFETESLAFDDFFIFFVEIDKAVSDWCRRDRKTEEIECEVEDEYPFLQNEITRENAGKVLAKTLLKIVSASQEESLAAKKEFLWHLVRLFEVFRVYTI